MSDVRKQLEGQEALARTAGKLINEMGDPVGAGNWAIVTAVYEVGIALLDKLEEILEELTVEKSEVSAIGFRMDEPNESDEN